MKIYIYLLILWNFIINNISTIEYKKNENILESERGNVTRLEEIIDISVLNSEVENTKNLIVIFHADWCGHW